MNASHWINALSASLFALLGIWAAVVRRHWFLRFAVVGGVLALALLVPAYEIVIEFGVAMGLIALAVGATRRPRPWRARWSIETILLAMVVAAAVAAVIGAAPTYGAEMWIRLFGIGFTISYFGLVCLWIVCGRARRSVRVVVGFAAIALYVVVMYVGEGILYSASGATGQARPGTFRRLMESWFQWEYSAVWMAAMFPSVAAGVGIMLTVLAASRTSGWFSREEVAVGPGARLAARGFLCLAMAAILTPNLYLLYRLCTPPELPAARIPVDNGYDDFLAAGRSASTTLANLVGVDIAALTDGQLADWFDKLPDVFGGIEKGLSKPSWATTVYVDINDAEPELMLHHYNALAMVLRIEMLERRGLAAPLVDACCSLIRLAEETNRGQRASLDTRAAWELYAMGKLRPLVGALSAVECKELIAQLAAIDAAREPFEVKLERDAAFIHRTSWQAHTRALLAEWSGAESADVDYWHIKSARNLASNLHLLMADAALQAYCLDHGRPPDALAELVPEYLAEVPVDALCDAPLRYRREGGAYRVYSVGWNGVDDGGLIDDPLGSLDGDYLSIGPHIKPLPRPLRGLPASAWTHTREWLQSAADAIWKAKRLPALTTPY